MAFWYASTSDLVNTSVMMIMIVMSMMYLRIMHRQLITALIYRQLSSSINKRVTELRCKRHRD